MGTKPGVKNAADRSKSTPLAKKPAVKVVAKEVKPKSFVAPDRRSLAKMAEKSAEEVAVREEKRHGNSKQKKESKVRDHQEKLPTPSGKKQVPKSQPSIHQNKAVQQKSES